MDSQDIEQAENLRRVYEQNWLHARHVENERLWFTNIYALVMAASLALMSTKGLILPLATFLLILSLLGFVMCHALRIAFIRHSRTSDIILRWEWQLKGYSVFYPMAVQPGGRTYESGERRKPVSLSGVFYYFYMLGTSVCAILLIQAIGHVHILYNLLEGGFVFGMLFLFRKHVFEKFEDTLHKEMGNIDRKAQENFVRSSVPGRTYRGKR